MSDLQIVLIVIGGVIIAGVLIFNWWQERKFHQQIAQNFSEFEQETPLATSEAATVSPLEISDDQDFNIDPHRFKDDESISAAESFSAETYYEELPANHMAQRPQQQDSTQIDADAPLHADTEDINADSAFDQALETIESIQHSEKTYQPEPAATDKSGQHAEIKAIIQNAFESAPAAASEETAYKTPDAIKVSESTVGQLPDMLHSQMDWAALLYLQGTASVQDVLSAIKNSFSNYDKPTFIHVQTAQGWLLLPEIADKAEFLSQPISKISCSIQLADRAGPIARSVLNRFQLAVESLGLDMNAHVEWQGAGDALTDAAALDQFCIEVDKTMGFHLLHGENGAFTGTKLRGLAEAQGMQLGNDGTFKFFDDSAAQTNQSKQPQFVMFNRDHYPFNADMLRTSVVKSITFQLDIPHVKNCIEAFNTMVQAAKQMETGLNAQLVDDNNRPLTDAQIEKIRHQLKIIQATMLTRGIAPGSDCAHRLFS